MMNPISIPRGIANIFLVGMCDEVQITEDWKYRPDKKNLGMRAEIINNHLSNVSPISCEKGKRYVFTNNLFMTYFGRI